jgi:ABC-2 type transport system permease protein
VVVVVTALAFETWQLGRRSFRRFYRVPANWIGIILFPLIQLFIFSELYKDIVQLPGFSGGVSYLAYLASGQVVFAAFFATAWSGTALILDYHSGYLDKLRVTPIHRVSILFGELVPLFIEAGVMAAVILIVSVVLGASIATGLIGVIIILALAGLLGVVWAGTSFLPALLTKSDQATGTLSIAGFPIAFLSTAFVPAAMMPEWIRVINDWNPLTYVIEAMRTLMTTGYDWAVIGRALLALAILGGILHGLSLWAFRRLTA